MHQVRLHPEGEWHRKKTDAETACGIAIDGPHATREYELTLDLCEVCHTTSERDTGRMDEYIRQLERESDPSLYFGDDEEPTDPGPG